MYPNYDEALNNLGNLLKDTSRPVEAEEMFNRALNTRYDSFVISNNNNIISFRVSPSFAAAWMNLGIVQAELKKFNVKMIIDFV